MIPTAVPPAAKAGADPSSGNGKTIAASIRGHKSRGFDICDLEGALLDAVGQNMRDLVDQAILVRPYDLACLLCQHQIGLEHLGILGNLLVLDRNHGA